MKENQHNIEGSFPSTSAKGNMRELFASTRSIRTNGLDLNSKYQHHSNNIKNMPFRFSKQENNKIDIQTCNSHVYTSHQSIVNHKKHIIFQDIKDERQCLQKINHKKKLLQHLTLSIKKLRETNSTLCQSPKACTQQLISKVNEFRKLKLLGQGKSGDVYMVKHIRTGFLAALKVIKKSIWQTKNEEENNKILTQLIREIKIQMYLNSPYLIKLYDFFADEDNVFLLMELASDGHLYDILLKNHCLSEEATAILMREIISGIDYMHRQSVMHRDLKLENIVLIHGMAKICDFGWSVYCPTNFRQTLCGTPLYLSPQILEGNQYSDKIDIWALGTLTHQLTTADNPFQIKRKEDLQRIISVDFQMKEGSPELKSFVNFILRKNPSKRPDADIILRHPFIQKYRDIETSEELCSFLCIKQ